MEPFCSMDNGLITFITTNECSARCAHCLMRSGPERHEKLTASQIKDAIERITEWYDAKVVVFTGGECTRLGDDLFESIAFASAKGLLTRIVTNGEWAETDESTKKMIESLRSVGLNEMNISYDDFHAAWIPLDYVVRVWKASKGQGFSSVVFAVGAGPRSRITPETMMRALGENVSLAYDELGRPNKPAAASNDGTSYMISNSKILRIGRGRALREDYSCFRKTSDVFTQKCPYQNTQPVITPLMHVAACCGINPSDNKLLDFGDIDHCAVDELQELYHRAIHILGPGYLVDMVRECYPDSQFGRKKYSSICEMCEDLTTSNEAIQTIKKNALRVAEDIRAEQTLTGISSAGEVES